jgi:hypothetical protein
LNSGLKELLASDDNPARLKEAWSKLVEELNFLEGEVNLCFMRRILGKQMIMEDKFDALAARKSFPTASSSNDYARSVGVIADTGPTTQGPVIANEGYASQFSELEVISALESVPPSVRSSKETLC